VKAYEKPGFFYLGREFELATKKLGEPLLYDSSDLVTHGVCVGMTGSGKTGLCIGLLEEAAIDGIPSIVIDPKGDLANLLLTFPQLRAQDFRPWVSQEEADKQKITLDELAQKQAEFWRDGLAQWDEDPERVQRLKSAADFTVYTPGSSAGMPVSILRSFAAPPEPARKDTEALRDRINIAATSLLGLVGISADPVQDREHILLSSLLDASWSQGRDLDLPELIKQILEPPFEKVGVVDLESFYPAKERSRLAMLVNNLLAAPSFQSWLEGDPLDIQDLLYTGEGKPRVSIFSIAHLSESERMFFVSLLLNEILGWVRAQSGSASLRAIIYMDEIFGFFPPVAEPPSKRPLLTLLKQARAYGVGVLLATQNPVDLDYKGLANAGTWFIGRLQTERDKDRLLEGLEGVAAGSKGKFDRGKTEEILAGLGKRVFLLYNVHEDNPVTFQTRWTLSYLAGPLTRLQIKELIDARRPTEPTAESTSDEMKPTEGSQEPVDAQDQTAIDATVPAGVPQYYLPIRGSIPPDQSLTYQAGVLAAATVNFVAGTRGTSSSVRVRQVATAPESALALNWEKSSPMETTLEDMDRQPAADAALAPLPAAMGKVASYRAWGTDFSDWLFRTQTMEAYKSPSSKLTSDPGESEEAFRSRIMDVATAKRDEVIQKLEKKYATKRRTLESRLTKAEQAVEREGEQSRGRKMQTAISFGATILGAIFGKVRSTGTVGRATTAMRDVSRSIDEAGDVKRAEQNAADAKQRLDELETQLQEEIDTLTDKTDPATEDLEKILMRPRKSDITLDALGVLWMPYWKDAAGNMSPTWG